MATLPNLRKHDYTPKFKKTHDYIPKFKETHDYTPKLAHLSDLYRRSQDIKHGQYCIWYPSREQEKCS